MRLPLLRLATLICAALVLGLAFSHVLELPQKMSYDAAQYARVQHTLYAYYAYVGGPLEVLSIVLAVLLAIALRRHGAPWRSAMVGAGLLAAGLGEWALVVQSANNKMAGWVAERMPAGWTGVRLQWELGHVGHFLVLGAGFVVLLWASLSRSDQPERSTPVGTTRA